MLISHKLLLTVKRTSSLSFAITICKNMFYIWAFINSFDLGWGSCLCKYTWEFKIFSFTVVSCSGECKIFKYINNSFNCIFFINNLRYIHSIYLLLKCFFLLCHFGIIEVSQSFVYMRNNWGIAKLRVCANHLRYLKASCMCETIEVSQSFVYVRQPLKPWILLLYKLVMIHLIPWWNDSNTKSVLLCNEDFGMADSTKKSVDWIINFSFHLYIIKLVLLISGGFGFCWTL